MGGFTGWIRAAVVVGGALTVTACSTYPDEPRYSTRPMPVGGQGGYPAQPQQPGAYPNNNPYYAQPAQPLAGGAGGEGAELEEEVEVQLLVGQLRGEMERVGLYIDALPYDDQVAPRRGRGVCRGADHGVLDQELLSFGQGDGHAADRGAAAGYVNPSLRG